MFILPKIYKLIVVTSLSLNILAGCTPARKPEPLPPNPPPKRPPAYTPPATPYMRPTPTPEDSDRLNMMLIRRVSSLPGVKSSSVVVVGNTAYVGVEKTANIGTAQVRDLKEDIPRAVKSFEPRVNTVMLTFRPDTKRLISKVSDDVAQGRPANIYASDLREIIEHSEPLR